MKLFQFILVLVLATSCQAQNTKTTKMDSTQLPKNPYYNRDNNKKVVVKEQEWKSILDPEVFRVAREKGTERPYTSKYENFKDTGTFYCAVCGNPLFVSTAKFESGCGWPSFFEPITKGAIIYKPDYTHGMSRTGTLCGKCNSHLGHVFEDGPPPTGLRYCINGVVLDFEKAKEAEKKFNEGKKG